MKNRRIFVSVNIDDSTKKYISDKLVFLKEKFHANWTDPEQFHITLFFLGFVEDESLAKICLDLQTSHKQWDSFDLFFDSLELAPSLANPKMLWLRSGSSVDFSKAKEAISQIVGRSFHKKSDFELRPHITLARLKKKQTISAPEISQLLSKASIKVSIPVSSIDIMESVNEKGVWKHYLIEQIEL